MVNAPCCCCPHPSFTGPRKPLAPTGLLPTRNGDRWTLTPAGSLSEPPTSPAPVKWIGQSHEFMTDHPTANSTTSGTPVKDAVR